MIHDDIKNFGKQFEWLPAVENGPLSNFKKFVVVGMGGSNLAADLVKIFRPDLDIIIHRDYGLPAYVTVSAGKPEILVVLNSYSGNTEEVLDAYNEAKEKNLPRVAVGAGGELLELAKKDRNPYIKFPESGIQPRVAVGWSFLAFLKVIGEEKLLKEAAVLAAGLKLADLEKRGKELAEKLEGSIPIIYASHRNKGLSYVWKINFNETAKSPAFANVFPELNHNEMASFSLKKASLERGSFRFVFLSDKNDHPRVVRRFAATEKILSEEGFEIEKAEVTGSSPVEKIFNSIVLAHFTAYHLAVVSGVEPEAVPVVERFKKMIK